MKLKMMIIKTFFYVSRFEYLADYIFSDRLK